MQVVDGFKQRGEAMTRLETFTDAAFAASFANILLFWYAHHVWSRRFGLDDFGSALWSFALVFVVLVYIYPLKALYSGAFDFFSGGYLDSYFSLSSVDDLRTIFILFGSAYIALSGVIVLLNRHALSKKDELELTELETYETVSTVQHWILNMVVPAISIVIALSVSDQWIVLAGLTYGLFGVFLPWHSIRRHRARPA